MVEKSVRKTGWVPYSESGEITIAHVDEDTILDVIFNMLYPNEESCNTSEKKPDCRAKKVVVEVCIRVMDADQERFKANVENLLKAED